VWVLSRLTQQQQQRANDRRCDRKVSSRGLKERGVGGYTISQLDTGCGRRWKRVLSAMSRKFRRYKDTKGPMSVKREERRERIADRGWTMDVWQEPAARPASQPASQPASPVSRTQSFGAQVLIRYSQSDPTSYQPHPRVRRTLRIHLPPWMNNPTTNAITPRRLPPEPSR
jgi:hypothetical protein